MERFVNFYRYIQSVIFAIYKTFIIICIMIIRGRGKAWTWADSELAIMEKEIKDLKFDSARKRAMLNALKEWEDKEKSKLESLQ